MTDKVIRTTQGPVITTEKAVKVVKTPPSTIIKPEPKPTVTTIGIPGPTGPEGPAGPAGDSFVHVQGLAQAVWIINHNMGFFPNVTVIASSGDIIEAEITYDSINSLTITHVGPLSGTAYLS